MADERRCSVDGCTKTHRARGYCASHYARMMRNGAPVLQPHATPQVRFEAKIHKIPGGCWIWTAQIGTHGYGVFGTGGRADRKMVYAHRFSYEMYVGPIPDGLHLDHLCRVKPCVNPDHLEPVTPRVNAQRGWRDAEHCRMCGASRNHWTK